jgi:hypothetical protein
MVQENGITIEMDPCMVLRTWLKFLTLRLPLQSIQAKVLFECRKNGNFNKRGRPSKVLTASMSGE